MVGLAILLPKKAHPLGKFVSLAIPELHTFIENDIMLSKEFEICGGLECTINTVKSCYNNQIPLHNHLHKAADLDLFASLGIKKLRYPLLWKTVVPHSMEEMNWKWTDSIIHELDITPIAGLLHYGSGSD
ncbi:MAG TPA: hypothetical protein VK141_09785 [Nitrosomonas sp.]|nr:hypothetical protein [Nitrosomonas sp.]